MMGRRVQKKTTILNVTVKNEQGNTVTFISRTLCIDRQKSVAKVVRRRSRAHGEREGLQDSRSHGGRRRKLFWRFHCKRLLGSVDGRARVHTHTHSCTHSCTHKLNRLGMIGSPDLDVHIAPWPRSDEPSEQPKHAPLGLACTQYGRRQNH